MRSETCQLAIPTHFEKGLPKPSSRQSSVLQHTITSTPWTTAKETSIETGTVLISLTFAYEYIPQHRHQQLQRAAPYGLLTKAHLLHCKETAIKIHTQKCDRAITRAYLLSLRDTGPGLMLDTFNDRLIQ
eukprot:1161491-Pelagomonas_calceolata.AAC.7